MNIEQTNIKSSCLKYVEVISCQKIFPCIEKVIDFKNKYIFKDNPVLIFDIFEENSYYKMRKRDSVKYNSCNYYMEIDKYLKFLARYFLMELRYAKKDRVYVKEAKNEIKIICKGSNIEQKWKELNFEKNDFFDIIKTYNEFKNDIPNSWISFVLDEFFTLPDNYKYLREDLVADNLIDTIKPLLSFDNIVSNDDNSTNLDIKKTNTIDYNKNTTTSNTTKKFLNKNHFFIEDFTQQESNNSNNSNNEIVLMPNNLKAVDLYFFKTQENKSIYMELTDNKIIKTLSKEIEPISNNLTRFNSLEYLKKNRNNTPILINPIANDYYSNGKFIRNNRNNEKNLTDLNEIIINPSEIIIIAVIISSMIFLISIIGYKLFKKFKKNKIPDKKTDNYLSNTHIYSIYE